MNNNKLAKVLERYLNLLSLRRKRNKHKQTLRGIVSKTRIINFFVKNGTWPSIKSIYVLEKKLGQRLENFTCPSNYSYDPIFRKIVLATGRKPTNKRKHNVTLFKEEIITFIKTHNRVPKTTNVPELIPGEHGLRQKLDYYTQVAGDMTFLGQVYDLDPCHRSGIPGKFRPLINASLDVDKPLIRLVK